MMRYDREDAEDTTKDRRMSPMCGSLCGHENAAPPASRGVVREGGANIDRGSSAGDARP